MSDRARAGRLAAKGGIDGQVASTMARCRDLG